MHPLAGIAIGALFWLWRRSRRRRNQEREERRRAKLPEGDDSTGAECTTIPNVRGVELFVRLWRVPDPQGVVLLIHSFAWHSGVFKEVATALQQRRYSVVGYDMEGHGRSGTGQKTWGDVRRFEHWIADGEKLVHFVKRKFPGVPLFVLGEGFGGSLALHLGIRMDRQLHGAIVCSPFVIPNLDSAPPSHITPVLMALEKLLPDVRISPSEEISQGDPFVMHSPTVRLFVQAHRALVTLERRLHQLKCPFMTLHGAQDDRACSQNSRELYDRARSQDKRLMIYDNMRSCLFGELEEDRSHVITDILAWLDARTEFKGSLRQEGESQEGMASAAERPRASSSAVKNHRRILSLLSRNGF